MVRDPDLLLLQELLDTICRRFKSPDRRYINIKMSCSRHPDDHNVHPDGFQLLELVEGMMDTCVQQIRTLDMEAIGENSEKVFELALSARLARQTEQLRSVGLNEAIILSSNNTTKDSVLGYSKDFRLWRFWEGWSGLVLFCKGYAKK